MKFLFLLLTLPFLFSFTFTPMTQTIDLTQDQMSSRFELHNDGNETIPVIIRAYHRIQNEDGTEKNPPAAEVKVFPPQLIIKPDEKRSIKITYKGKKDINIEKSYRIVAEQIPLEVTKGIKEKSAGIKMLLRYRNALYVEPNNVTASVDILKYEKSKGKLKVWVSNTGSKHQYLNGTKIIFTHKKNNIALSKEDLKKIEGQNILAKTKRVFSFEYPKKLNSKYKAQLSFEN